MIAKLERTLSNAQPNIKNTESQNASNNQQRINNNRPIALKSHLYTVYYCLSLYVVLRTNFTNIICLNQTNIIEAFNSTSRYLDDLLRIDNPYFDQTVGQIYPNELS